MNQSPFDILQLPEEISLAVRSSAIRGVILWQVRVALLFQPVLLQPAAYSRHRAAGADDSAITLGHVFSSIKTICFLEPKSSSNLICRFALSLLISPHKTTQENSIVLLNSLGCSHANVSQQSASPKLLFQLKYLGKCWIDCHKIWYRQPRCPGVESDFCWLWWSNFFLLASSWCQGIELYIFSCPANISVSTWCIGRKFGSLRLHPNDSGVTEV